MTINLIREIRTRKAERNDLKIEELNQEWNQLNTEYCYLVTNFRLKDPTAVSIRTRIIELRDDVEREIMKYL